MISEDDVFLITHFSFMFFSFFSGPGGSQARPSLQLLPIVRVRAVPVGGVSSSVSEIPAHLGGFRLRAGDINERASDLDHQQPEVLEDQHGVLPYAKLPRRASSGGRPRPQSQGSLRPHPAL